MAAKLLHSLADDNPDLQKQIGCMTGIIHMFDRQQMGRRLIGHSHKRLLPPGNRSQFDNVDHDFDNTYNKQERARSKHINDKRVSAESSKASFSSSSRSSSFSSLDFGKINHLEPSLMDQIIFPETPSRDQVITQTGASQKLGRLSLDLRDVVKDSMYKEARGLSVQTTMKEGGAGSVARKIGAPRPPQLSKYVDATFGENSKLDSPSDLRESLEVLAKLREAPWYCNEESDDERLSHDTKDGPSLFPVHRDAPRYSYDGRVTTSYFSFEPQDISRSNEKLRDLPRLSLDSRERCTKQIGHDPNNNLAYLPRNSQAECETCGGERVSTVQQQPSRPSSVVAKLMGLDTMPEPEPESKPKPLGLIKQPGFEDQSCSAVLPLKIKSDVCRPLPLSRSHRSSSRREPTSPRWKNADMKPVSNSKFPIEPAPWKHHHSGQASQKQATRQAKTIERTSNSSPSVYSEIEKRLKDLEFKQSGKDLRALKQILEAMQEKGLLGNPKEEPSSNVNVGTQRESQQSIKGSKLSAGLVNPYILREDFASASGSALGGAASSSSSRVFESPIVIMKPAKLAQKCGVHPSSVLPIDCLHGVRSSHGSEFANHSKYSVNQRRITSDLAPRDARRDQASTTINKKANITTSRGPQSLTRSQLVSKDNNAISSSMSASSTTSPRLQQKKQMFDRRSCSSAPRQPIPPGASGKSRKQSIRQSTDAGGSPGGRRRPKAFYTPENDILLGSVCNSSRKMNLQGSVVDLVQATDSRGRDTDMEEVASNSNEQSAEASASIQLSEVLLMKDMDGDDTETTTLRSREDILVKELTIALRHPNPVAVLDDYAYREDSPSPPVKQTPQNLGGSRTKIVDEVCAQGQGNGDNLAPKDGGSRFTSEINQKKLQDIEELVQKLRRLNSSHDEAHTDYIASLCDNNHSNPDHRYISEILLASGLLLGDLSSGLGTIQLHPSGNPINPELFFVLEQTKARNNFIHENNDNPSNLKLRLGKLKRKLIFDAVNEILVTKLVSAGLSHEPWLKTAHKLAKKTFNAQKLLKELCTEVEELRGYSEKQNFFLDGEVDEADELKNILFDDVLKRSEDWTSLYCDVSVVVLDVERSIFKDLVDEIVIGEGTEAFGLGGKTTRRCSRQLFSTKV